MNGLYNNDLLSVKMSRSVINRYKPAQVKWHYEHGLVLQSIYAVGRKYDIIEFPAWVKIMYDTKINIDGTINTYKDEEYNLDQINPGKNLFDLYNDTGEKKYLKAIEILKNQLDNQPRTQSGGFWHKKIYPWQMWLDGLYMQGPFYARYIRDLSPEKDYEDLVHQFELVYEHTRNKESGLLYHAWDESCKQLWADPVTGCSPHFWGRAMGWFSLALTDVLSIIPDEEAFASYRKRLIDIAVSLVEPILSVQDDKSGLWYQVLDMPMRSKNYLETSCSAMFTCFLYRIVRNNWLPSGAEGKLTRSSLLAAADKGWRGLCSRVSQDADGNLHLSGICSVAGLGGKPYRDGSYEYYVKEAVVSDDFKGVGPFILAALESEIIQ
ncbi:MAG: glycoside hydrolase family 88 protein [Treponemataceae bacterium]|nr:glycoside hydrolase family 88 protein [Treponemataceae bacterium]